MDPNNIPIQTPHYTGGNNYSTPGPSILTGNDGSQFGAHHGVPPSPWAMSQAYGFPPTPGRFTPWSEQKIASMQVRLQKQLGPEYITQRPGPGGGPKLSYIEGWKVVNLANDVFGFNGWSSSITSLKTDFLDVNAQGRVFVGITAIVRVTLQDGCYHEDIGYGHAENIRDKASALEKAQKEAVTDGVKRALKHFGNVLGNCLYDKNFLKDVGKMRVGPAKFNAEELERRPEFTPQGAPRSAASAVPQHVSGNVKPPAPAPAPPPVARPETPLRSVADDSDVFMEDTEFGYVDGEFFDDMDESVLASKAETNVPMLAPETKAGSKQATTGYQHRHRPDMLPPPEPARPHVSNGAFSGSRSVSPGTGDVPAKRAAVGGFAKPNGDSTSSAFTSAASSRRAAILAGLHQGGAAAPESRPESPRIPSGGIDSVVARAQPNFSMHGTNLEIEDSEEVDTSVKYTTFTSARGVKRDGSQSPTKWNRAAVRSALSEIPNVDVHGEVKRPRVSM